MASMEARRQGHIEWWLVGQSDRRGLEPIFLFRGSVGHGLNQTG